MYVISPERPVPWALEVEGAQGKRIRVAGEDVEPIPLDMTLGNALIWLSRWKAVAGEFARRLTAPPEPKAAPKEPSSVSSLREELDGERSRAASLEEELSAASLLLDEAATRSDELAGEVERLSEESARLKGRLASEGRRADAAEARLVAASPGEAAALTMATIEALPTDLSGVMGLVSALWGERIVFLPEAYRAAQDFSWDVNEAFRILRSLALDLWELAFTQAGDISAKLDVVYRQRTGFELGLSDGSFLNAARDYLRQREFRYDGRTIRCLMHVKGKGVGPRNAFRVYFAIDRETNKIVVGSVGGHLPTPNFSS